MGQFTDTRRGRRLDDLRSPHGDRMVFPRSWEHGEPDRYAGDEQWVAQGENRPVACAYCDNPLHDGLEALSEQVRGKMIESLLEHGDPDGLLDAYDAYLAAHPQPAVVTA